MSRIHLFRNRLRDSSALLITAGLHLGVAAIALVAVTVSVPIDKPPLIAIAVPDTVIPPAPAPDPRTPERPLKAIVKAPIFTVDTVPVPEQWPDSRPDEPAIAGPIISDKTTPTPEPTPRVTGPTQGARFDPRHAGAAQPPYPAAARRMGEEGSVVVHVTIGRDGRVLAATVAQSSGSPRLDAAAIAQALKAWRFTPALADGEAVEAARDITVRFRLADG